MALIVGGEEMNKINIGDKVILKDYHRAEGEVVGVDISELCNDKYLVKTNSLGTSFGWSFEEAKRNFGWNFYKIVPYDGYAIWTDDIEKVEGVEKNIMNRFKPSRFKLGEVVIYKGLQTSVLAIDRVAKEDNLKYAIKCKYDDYTLKDVKNYSSDSMTGRYLIDMEASDDIGVLWVRGEVLKKIEETIEDTETNNIEETSHFIKIDAEKEFEDYILNEYKKLREQKKETIKEMKAEIKKIRKEWNL